MRQAIEIPDATTQRRFQFRRIVSFTRLFLLGLCFTQFGASLFANDSSAFSETMTVSIDGQDPLTLNKTGESLRQVVFFKVYLIAHYTDQISGEGDIRDYQGAKGVQMIFQRKIDGPRIQEEIEKAIRNRIPPEEWEAVKDTVAAYAAPYGKGEVNKGDSYSVAWLPDGTVINKFNGEEVNRVQGQRFARALWTIWVGNDSLVNANDLLGNWAPGQDG